MSFKLIMPMAGRGTRFPNENIEKPLIKVNGLPMFVFAERCIDLDFSERIFIVRREQNLKEEILNWYPDARIIELEKDTEGTACTILTAQKYIQNSSIFISNCDQYVEWNSKKFISLISKGVDGVIPTFLNPEKEKKWSFAEIDENDNIVRVAEKDPISKFATVGWYYFKEGKDFINSANAMINYNDKVNNEFYTCPTYNYLLRDKSKIVKPFLVDKMQGIGTADDLINFKKTNE